MVEKEWNDCWGRRDRTLAPDHVRAGGIYVEVMKDVAFAPCRQPERNHGHGQGDPLTASWECEEKKKDLDGVVDTIIKVGTVLRRCERITDIEINPHGLRTRRGSRPWT
jgi:hypothetical protein